VISERRLSQVAVPAARLIFAGMFAMAFAFKVMGMGSTAAYIAAAGFPIPMVLAVLAAMLELALTLCFLTGAFFSEAALAATIYVLFLGFAFHGPSHWAASQAEFGFFMDHFTFAAGLLFAAAYGPGTQFALRRYRLLAPAKAA
jgi:putative oxidoreductase